MKTLTIKWQRLVAGGKTCPRCGNTGEQVRKAARTLRQVLAPLDIEVNLEEVEISRVDYERAPLESNRILLEGRSLEEWLGGKTGQSPCCDVCGPNDCRTVTVDEKSYESIPAELVVRAGLLAAAGMTGQERKESCCGPQASSEGEKDKAYCC